MARSTTIGNQLPAFTDYINGLLFILLWSFLTLSLEAKHKHSYRSRISWKTPILILLFASTIALYHNYQSFIFLLLVCIFTYFYISKEKYRLLGFTSFINRGLYEAALYFFGVTLYLDIYDISSSHLLIGSIIFFLYASRNLIGDIRDIKFDKKTLAVKIGPRYSYLISLFFYLFSIIILLKIEFNFWMIFPPLIMTFLILFYDNGYSLHRSSILITSCVSLNIILLQSTFTLFFLNIFFISVLSNIIFYESIPRKSNPKFIINSRFRFIISKD